MAKPKVYNVLLHCVDAAKGNAKIQPLPMTTYTPPNSTEKKMHQQRIKCQMVLDGYTKEGEVELILEKIEYID